MLTVGGQYNWEVAIYSRLKWIVNNYKVAKRNKFLYSAALLRNEQLWLNATAYVF